MLGPEHEYSKHMPSRGSYSCLRRDFDRGLSEENRIEPSPSCDFGANDARIWLTTEIYCMFNGPKLVGLLEEDIGALITNELQISLGPILRKPGVSRNHTLDHVL